MWCQRAPESNKRSESISEFIVSSNLSTESVGCESTFVTNTRKGVFDITLSNELAVRIILKCRVSSEPSMSDIRCALGVKAGNPRRYASPRTQTGVFLRML